VPDGIGSAAVRALQLAQLCRPVVAQRLAGGLLEGAPLDLDRLLGVAWAGGGR